MNIGFRHIRYFSDVKLKNMTNYDSIPMSPNVLSKLFGNEDRQIWLHTEKAFVSGML